MPPSMIRPAEGSIPKVRGSSRATPMAADSPGMQPMTIPMVTLAIMITIFMGESALTNPMAINAY